MSEFDRHREIIRQEMSRLSAWIRDYGHEKQKPFVDDLQAALDRIAAQDVEIAALRAELKRCRDDFSDIEVASGDTADGDFDRAGNDAQAARKRIDAALASTTGESA